MALDGWRLIAISLDYPHHAGGSGYGQLARQIEFDHVVTPPSGFIAKAYGSFVHKSQKVKLISRLTRRKIATEVRYLLRHSFSGKRLVHVFYGEHHSWLLRMRKSGSSSRKVMTIHLPPSLWHVSFKPGQLGHFDAIILMSDSQVAPLRDELGYGGRIEVIPHGVDISRFPFVERRPTQDKIDCIMVGNFLRDYEALGRIATRTKEQGLPIHFHVVANAEASAPLQDNQSVTVHRKVSDQKLLELYNSAQVGVFTMEDCTANNALLEAMATGLPIVANDVGGIGTYTDPSFCTFAPLDDEDAFIRSIQAWVEDPARYEAAAKAAREKAESFAWDRVAEQTLRVYRECTA